MLPAVQTLHWQGRQRWLPTPVSGETNMYTFQVAGGRDASCGTYMSAGQECNDTSVNLVSTDDSTVQASGRQRWILNLVVPFGTKSSTSSFPFSSSSPKLSAFIVGMVIILLALSCVIFFGYRRRNRDNILLPAEPTLSTPRTPVMPSEMSSGILTLWWFKRKKRGRGGRS